MGEDLDGDSEQGRKECWEKLDSRSGGRVVVGERDGLQLREP